MLKIIFSPVALVFAIVWAFIYRFFVEPWDMFILDLKENWTAFLRLFSRS